MTNENLWISGCRTTLQSHQKMIDAAVGQLTDEEFACVPGPGLNSVATILRHVAGNLNSRWTDFLSSDGEKPDRNRDGEFSPWEGSRESLMQYFHEAVALMDRTFSALSDEDLERTVTIRGEPHSVPLAIERGLTHIAYHSGQIMWAARLVHQGQWNWLTIAPGRSQQHNETTWGTPASRSIQGDSDE